MATTKCPICFPYPNSSDHQVAANVPSGDGNYVVHLSRSLHTDHYNRECPWQKKDHRQRINRLKSLSG